MRNGRLSILVWLVGTLPWLFLQVRGVETSAPYNQLIWTLTGLMVGNLALKKEKKEAAQDQKVENLEYVVKRVVTRDLDTVNQEVMKLKKDKEEASESS